MTAHQLAIGTTNLKKGQELQELLAPFGFEVQTLRETGLPVIRVNCGRSPGPWCNWRRPIGSTLS